MPSISRRNGLGQRAPRSAKSGLAALSAGFARRFAAWLMDRPPPRRIDKLDDHLLRDIGLSRADAQHRLPPAATASAAPKTRKER
jgi:uncharacterized protein YjiS (DUF1127 family)